MLQFLPSMREQKMNEIIQYLTNNLTLPFIFILGMFHALEPGHGKTFILAYLTGGKIHVWGALQLIIALIIKIPAPSCSKRLFVALGASLFSPISKKG